MHGSVKRFGVLCGMVAVAGVLAGAGPAQAGPGLPSAGLVRAAGLAQVPAGLRSAVESLAARQRIASGVACCEFGWSVAVSGSTAVIGDLGPGVAYVFVQKGAKWSQQAELTASNRAANDLFGYAVAVSGSTAVIGAGNANSFAGAAYVFARSVTKAKKAKWSQQAELTDPHPDKGVVNGDRFGDAVAVSGSTAVIGAYGRNSGTGAAYVFARSVTKAKKAKWSQQAELTASNRAANDLFGWSVAVSGSTAVIGAPYANSLTGAAYVFTRSVTKAKKAKWSQQAELAASGSGTFGWSVAVSGPTAVIGAPDFFTPDSATGAAYVFARSGTTWSQRAELTASDGAVGDELGYTVAVSGPTAVIGAPYKNSDTGAAYVFARSGTTWSQRAELTASDGAANGLFGWSVAVSGPTAVIGTPYNNSDTGAAYVFARSGTTWSQQAEI